MGKSKTVEPAPQPTISYSRSLTLDALDSRELRLRHLRELVREATERGYSEDAPVAVYAIASFMDHFARITVGGKE